MWIRPEPCSTSPSRHASGLGALLAPAVLDALGPPRTARPPSSAFLDRRQQRGRTRRLAESVILTWLPSYSEVGLGYSRLEAGTLFGSQSMIALIALIALIATSCLADRLMGKASALESTAASFREQAC